MKKSFLIHKLRQRIKFEDNYHKQKVIFIVPAGIIKGTVTLPRDYDESVQYDNDGYTHMQDIEHFHHNLLEELLYPLWYQLEQ